MPNSDLLAETSSIFLPAFASSHLPASVADFLQAGGMAVLLGETRAEYEARAMSPVRRATESSASLRALINEIRSCAQHPVLVAVDHELGGIQRCEGLVAPLPTAAEAREMRTEMLRQRCFEVGTQLRNLGVDLVLGPVLDTGSDSSWLRGRQLAGSVEDRERVAAAFVSGFENAGIATVPKHFPGHRGLLSDPMIEADALVPISRADLYNDVRPFRAAIDAGARCMMMGPGRIPILDELESAVCSPAAGNFLRTDCQFHGVVISDDIDAPAVTQGRELHTVTRQALTAGNDLLLVSAEADVLGLAARLAEATIAGDLPRHRLADAHRRVSALAHAQEQAQRMLR